MSADRTRALGVLALLVAGCGGSSEPLAPQPSLSVSAVEARSADGTYAVRWEPVGGAIPDAEPFDIRFAVRRCDGRALPNAATFTVDAEMPHHGHGMNLVPLVERLGRSPEGEIVRASGMLLHMPGRWVLSIDIEEAGVAERTQWFVDVE